MTNRQKVYAVSLLAASVALGAVSARSAEEKPSWKGTIKVEMAAIAKQAKVTDAEARKAALAAVKGKVKSSELATESDSLLYEIKIESGGKEKEVLEIK